jgi:hypothetical protein
MARLDHKGHKDPLVLTEQSVHKGRKDPLVLTVPMVPTEQSDLRDHKVLLD